MLNAGPFAGVGAPPAGWPTGASVDQRIAEGLAVPTKLRSLELGVQVGAADNWGRMIYRAANQPLPPDDDPASVYARVFADLHTDPAVLARLRRRRKSILDGVGAQFSRTSARLGSADRQRLDAHLTAVREIETRLTTDLVVNNPSCHDPTHHARVGGRQRRVSGGGRAADGPDGRWRSPATSPASRRCSGRAPCRRRGSPGSTSPRATTICRIARTPIRPPSTS